MTTIDLKSNCTILCQTMAMANAANTSATNRPPCYFNVICIPTKTIMTPHSQIYPHQFRSSYICRKNTRSKSRFYSAFLPVAQCDSGSVNVDDDESLPGVQVKTKQSGNSSNQVQDTFVSPMEINQWMQAESGLDRLKSAYSFSEDAKFANEDTRNLTTMLYRTILLGFCVNVFTESQKQEKRQKYLSKSEAAVRGPMRERAALMGTLKEALRGSLRMSLAAVTVFHLPHVIATYRNETTQWEFSLSSGLACGMMGQGLMGILKGVAGGSVFGLVAGYFITGFLERNGLSQEQRHLERVKQYILDRRHVPSAEETDSL